MPRSGLVIVIRLELSGAGIGEIVETAASAASVIVGGEESLGNVVTERCCIVLPVTHLDPRVVEGLHLGNGCKGCGRGFCSSCLGFNAIVPRCGDTQQKVCKQCHGELTSRPSKSNSARWSPPENYKKRIAALEARQNQTQSPQKGLVKSQSQTDSRYRGLSKEDKILMERLERLKKAARPKSIPSQGEIESRLAALKADSGRPVPTAQEMEDRLAALQGRALPSAAPRPVYQVSSSKTQAEQSNDLLNQMAEEVTIDESGGFTVTSQGFSLALIWILIFDVEMEAKVRTQNWNDLNQTDGTTGTSDLSLRQLEEEKTKLLAQAAAELREENTREEKILEVAKRLAVLKGKDPETVTLDDYKLPNSDEEEEEAIQRVLKQAQASVVTKHLIWPPKTPDSDEEELPWCCICNEDATVRCHSCDDDLYCQRCFRESHDEYDWKEHRTSGYRPPRQQK
ncbi:hypothetical protein Chor_016709 [Crotalus horridus]